VLLVGYLFHVLIRGTTNDLQQPATHNPQPTTHRQRNTNMSKTIMIVDDAVSIRGLASMTLENSGYRVIEATNGKDALEKISGQHVDLIIADLYMPQMDGIELIQLLKADSRYKFIPIVVLTKESGTDMKRQGQTAGAKAWVIKPFKPNTILNVVQKIIG
jgi:two-component system chemotaxis response regulator CheY